MKKILLLVVVITLITITMIPITKERKYGYVSNITIKLKDNEETMLRFFAGCEPLDGKVIAGTKAQKIRSKSFNAFNSINLPELAKIVDGNIFQYIYQEIKENVKFYNKLNEKVSIVTLTPGMNKNIIDAYFKENDAVIVSSYGTGGIPNRDTYSILGTIEYWLKQGKILVMATQVQQEGSDMSIYHVALRTKEKLSFLEAFDMNLPSVLTKMMWILSLTNDINKIKELFYTTINYDILYKGKE